MNERPRTRSRSRSFSRGHPLIKLLGDLEEGKVGQSWANREKALLQLQKLIESANPDSYPDELIKLMRIPLLAQLTDKRSVIVREVCKLIVICSTVLKDRFAIVAKDLVLRMIKIVASGNKVIAAYANACCCDVFRNTQIRHVINHVVDLLEMNKSKDIRESCVTYITISLTKWDKAIVEKSAERIQQALTLALQDASENVRKKARECYFNFEKLWPQRAIEVLRRADKRTQQTLYAMLNARSQAAMVEIKEETGGEDSKAEKDGIVDPIKTSNDETDGEAADGVQQDANPSEDRGGVSGSPEAIPSTPRWSLREERSPDCSFRSILKAHRHHLDSALKLLSAEIKLYQEYEVYEDKPEGAPSKALCTSYVNQLKDSLKSRYESIAALHEHFYEESDSDIDVEEKSGDAGNPACIEVVNVLGGADEE